MDGQRRQQLIDAFARRIASLGMTTPAILFLEMHKPLAFLGAQMLWVAQPILSFGFGDADLHDLARLLEDHASVEELIARLESTQLDSAPSSLSEKPVFSEKTGF